MEKSPFYWDGSPFGILANKKGFATGPFFSPTPAPVGPQINPSVFFYWFCGTKLESIFPVKLGLCAAKGLFDLVKLPALLKGLTLLVSFSVSSLVFP